MCDLGGAEAQGPNVTWRCIFSSRAAHGPRSLGSHKCGHITETPEKQLQGPHN